MRVHQYIFIYTINVDVLMVRSDSLEAKFQQKMMRHERCANKYAVGT